MGRFNKYPKGFRLPGSDLVVVDVVGHQQIGLDRGQWLKTICLRPRIERGGEPCGNERIILAKRLRKTRACLECSYLNQRRPLSATDPRKRKSRKEPFSLMQYTPETAKTAALRINKKNRANVRAALEEAGGIRWAEFLDMERRRMAIREFEDDTGRRPFADAWTEQMEIEALQTVLFSPASGKCCFPHANGKSPDPSDPAPSEWREFQEENTERIKEDVYTF